MSVLIDHRSAPHGQLVDHVGHGLFISGDRGGAKHHHIGGRDGDLLVKRCRHAGQSRHGLALASGGNDHRGLRGIISQLLDVDQRSLRHIDVVQLPGNLHHRDHTAALHDHLAAVFVRRVHDLLHAVHVRGEGRHNDPVILVLRENGVKGLAHRALGHGKSGTDGIGTVRHQRQHALFAQLRKALQVDGISKHRGVIDLEVARVKHRAHRGVDG